MLSALDKFHFDSAYSLAKLRARTNGRKTFADELQSMIDQMPERELERIRRVEQMQLSRLDVTHPPTAYRIEMLKAHRVSGRKIVASPTELEQIAQELQPVYASIQADLAGRSL